MCKLSSFRFSCTCPSEAGPEDTSRSRSGKCPDCLWETHSSTRRARVGPQRLREESQKSTYNPAANPLVSLSQASPRSVPIGPAQSSSSVPGTLSSVLPQAGPCGYTSGLSRKPSHSRETPTTTQATQSSPFTELQHLEPVMLNPLRYLSLLHFSPLSFVKSRLWTRWRPRSPLPVARCSEL